MSTRRVGRPRLSDTDRAERSALARGRIVDAALTEFVERGYHETGIPHVGERLGAAPSMVYYYFSGKREILEYAVEEAFEKVAAILAGSAAAQFEPQDFDDAAAKFGRAIAEVLTADPRVARMLVLIANSNDPELRARWTSFFHLAKGMVTAYLEEGVRSGRLDPDLDPERTARIIIAIPVGLIACDPDRIGDESEGHALVDAATAMVSRAIHPPKASPPVDDSD